MADSLKAVEQSSDEIDLIEVFRTLWDKKWWIVLTTFITTLLAGIYAFTAKEQWTSKANVIAPRVTELGNLLPIRAEYARITGNSEFSAEGLANVLHDNFRYFLLSDDLKKNFLEQSSWVNKELEDKSEQEKRKFVSDLIMNYLKVHRPANKKKDETELEEIGLMITFTSEKPENAQYVLSQYLEYVNNYVVNELNKEFKVGFDLLLDNLKFHREQIASSIDESKTVQVNNLEKALSIAKKAGIAEFTRNLTSAQTSFIMPEYLSGEAKLNISDSKLADGTYLFMLGEKYLQAQLDIAKDKGFTYPLEYYQIDRKIFQLEPLYSKLTSIKDVKAYRYLASPNYPVSKDKPKRAIILLIGLVVGLVLGILIVLMRKMFLYLK